MTKVILHKLFLLAFAVQLSLALSSLSYAFESPKLQWFNSDGHIAIVHWKTDTRWVWKEQKPGEIQPALEVTVHVPEQVQAAEVTSPNARMFTPPSKGGKGPRKQILVLETQLPSTTVALNVRSKNGKEKVEKVGLMVSLEPASPKILVHESCVKNGVSFKPVQPGGGQGIFFVGLSCNRGKSEMTVQFHLPEGVTLLGPLTRKFGLNVPSASETIHFEPSSKEKANTADFTLSIKKIEQRTEST